MKALLLLILVSSILLLPACSGVTTITNTVTQSRTVTQPAEKITITLTTTQPAQTVTDTITSTTTKTLIPAEDGFIRITCEEVLQLQMGLDITAYKAVDARWGGWMSARLHNAVQIPNTYVPNIYPPMPHMPLEERQEKLKLLKIYIYDYLVFYDQGEETTAADLAQQLVDINEEQDLGFDIEKIRILEGGFDRWQELAYPTDFG